MRLDELRRELDALAGSSKPASVDDLARVRRAARRGRVTRVALTASALVVSLAVAGALFVRERDHHAGIRPADSTPTTTTQSPPTVDPKALFDQPRIGVSDHDGKVRGTIPTSAYKAAMGITSDGSPPPTVRDNTPVPVLGDDGRLDGYWIPAYGFVERAVVERPGFDPDAFAAKQNAEDDSRWWASLTPEQQAALEAQGITAPSTTAP